MPCASALSAVLTVAQTEDMVVVATGVDSADARGRRLDHRAREKLYTGPLGSEAPGRCVWSQIGGFSTYNNYLADGHTLAICLWRREASA